MRERNYNQNCALARASDLLGERWTLLIVRDLLVAPRRFGELEQRLKGMGTNLLAKRLKDMRATGLISGGEERTSYSLTEMGKALEPMVLHMVRWSLRWISGRPHVSGLHFPDWDLIALKSLFVPDPKLKKPLVARFQSSDWIAWVRLHQQGYSYGLGEPDEVPDILFPGPITALRAPDRLLAEMDGKMRGQARRFIDCFAVS